MRGTAGGSIAAGTILALCALVVAGEPRVWSGPDREFTKADGADWKNPANQDRITDDVWLTRQDGYGLFNIAREDSCGVSPSPGGTEWAYGTAAAWADLEFRPWRDWAYPPPDAVGKDAVLHLVEKDVYVDIRFLSWTSNGMGGGFSYRRATEGVPGEKVWTGTPTTFTKPPYADFTDPANQDRIAPGVWITRQDDRGLFNIAREVSYDARAGAKSPPSGTEWAWGSAADWQTLPFACWHEWNGDNPPGAVGKSAVLHLLKEDVYIDIKFLSWTESSNGGGFSYERATEAVPGQKVWTGPKTTFTKTNYADWLDPEVQDRITEDVRLTRADDRGLFNIAGEPGYDFDPDALGSPAGTEWAYGTTGDLEHLRFENWYAWHGRDPRDTVGRPAVLHLIREDAYIDIKFLSWTGDASGGGFSYERSTEATPGQRIWNGPKITFTKADYADWKAPVNQDRLSKSVWMTRQDRRGLFNLAAEPGYQETPRSPTLTEWAWGKAADWESLSFMSWRDWAYPPPSTVGRDAVLHLLDEDVYVDIRMLGWSDDALGGGFSYERATRGTPGEKVWTGPRVTFTKRDYADFSVAANQDRITPAVWLTRQDRRGLFNIACEPYYGFYPFGSEVSPRGTEWAWGTASEWESLRFHRWRTWHGGSTMGGPPNTVGRSVVLHLIEEDAYVDVKFLHWTDGGEGGGFSYERATRAAPGEKVWSGPKTFFLKADFTDWTDPAHQDRLNDDVRITRAGDQGIFNAVSERGWCYDRDDYEGDGSGAPAGTEWAWGTAAGWRDLDFRPWSEWNDDDPAGMIGRNAVLHLIDDDVYVDVRFLRWTPDPYGKAGGGGFSYVRGANSVPVLLSGPSASPAVATAGEPVAFTVGASDPDGDALDIAWDFGDGGHGTGASPTHAYEDPGEYTASVVVGDGMASFQRTVAVKVALPLGIQKMQGKVDFRTTGRDGIRVTGILGLPAGFLPAGKTLRVDVGGVAASFVMDEKGRGAIADGKLALKYNRKASAWVFTVDLANGQHAGSWADEGVVDADLMIPLALEVSAVVDGTPFFATAHCTYKCKAGKAGSFR